MPLKNDYALHLNHPLKELWKPGKRLDAFSFEGVWIDDVFTDAATIVAYASRDPFSTIIQYLRQIEHDPRDWHLSHEGENIKIGYYPKQMF